MDDSANEPAPLPPPTPKLSHRSLPPGSESPLLLPESSSSSGHHVGPAATFTPTLPERLSPTRPPPVEAETPGDESWSSEESSSDDDLSTTPGRKAQRAVYDPQTGVLAQLPYIWVTDKETGFVREQPVPLKLKHPVKKNAPRRKERSASPPIVPERRRTSPGPPRFRLLGPKPLPFIKPAPPSLPALNRPLQTVSRSSNSPGGLPFIAATSVGQAPGFRSGLRPARESTPAPGVLPSSEDDESILGKGELNSMDEFFASLNGQAHTRQNATSPSQPEKRSSPPYEPSSSPEPRDAPMSDRSQTPAPGALASSEPPTSPDTVERGRFRERRPSKTSSTASNANPRHRSRTPVMEPGLVGHGYTTYAKLPDDQHEREVLLEDDAIADYKHEEGFFGVTADRRAEEYNKPFAERARNLLKENDMNETWGPEIQDHRSRRAKSKAFIGNHPSATGVLGPHYNKGEHSQKRISSGAEDMAGGPGKKKLRKKHRKLTAPAMERESTPDQHMTERHPDDQPRSRSISGHPPQQGSSILDGRANYEIEGDPMDIDDANQEVAPDQQSTFTPEMSEAMKSTSRDSTNRFAFGQGATSSANPASGQQEDKMGDSTEADRALHPAAAGRRQAITPELSDEVRTAIGNFNKSVQVIQDESAASASPAKGKENAMPVEKVAELISQLADGRGKRVQSDQEASEFIQRQADALKEANLRRDLATVSRGLDAGSQLLKAMNTGGKNARAEVDTSDMTGGDTLTVHGAPKATSTHTTVPTKSLSKSRLIGTPDIGPITAHRVVMNRILEYHVQYEARGVWLSAEMMTGHDWDQEIAEYWYRDESRVATLRYLQRPRDDNLEPGQYGRFVKTAELVDHRRFQFDVRDFECFADQDDEHSV
ncbi:hypothetical protein LTR85_006415 [Meristemomyces frigidus]|nr:hypothetical protein LTR85_006415 [Meristemomyces frigidus]